MKRFLFSVASAALILPATLSAQVSENASWRKTEGHQVRKNSIMFSSSLITMTLGGYNSVSILANFHIEYDRALCRNLSVSGVGLYADLTNGGFGPDVFSVHEHFWFAGVKINYNLPVVRNWLYFRVGLGAGAGIHSITDYDMGFFWEPDSRPLPPPPGIRLKVHMVVDAYWVFRVAHGFDLRFAPLLVLPSYLVFGSKLNVPYNYNTYKYYNFFTLGATVRF